MQTIDDDLPLSVNQIWTLSTVAANAQLHSPLALELFGPLDVGALERALNEIVARHEILRTGFVRDASGAAAATALEFDSLALRSIDPELLTTFRQSIYAAVTLPLVTRDLRSLSEDRRRDEIDAITSQTLNEPFDLARPPLMRAVLMRTRDEVHVLLLVLHHIICDFWSLAIVVDEMTAGYERAVGGAQHCLPPLPIQFADFAYWERRRLSSGALDDSIAYWRKQWEQYGDAALRFSDLPFALPVGTIAGGARLDGRGHLELDSALVGRLRPFLREHGVTTYMTLLAAWAAALHRCTRRSRLVIWSPFANRTRLETEALIGYFANIQMLGIECCPDMSLRELLAGVRTMVLDAQTHQSVPTALVWSVLKSSEPEAVGASSSDLWLAFDMVAPAERQVADTLTIRRAPPRERAPLRGLKVTAVERSDRIDLWTQYAADRMLADHVMGLVIDMRSVLEAMVERPGMRLSELGEARVFRSSSPFGKNRRAGAQAVRSGQAAGQSS